MADPRAENTVSSRYRPALDSYLASASETDLQEAYHLGREALHNAIGLLDLVGIHQAAETEIINSRYPGETREFAEKTGRFLREALAPFEMMQVGHRDSNRALRHLNLLLEEEANRIAHALHDDAGQLLATTYLELAAIERRKPEKVITDDIQRIRSHLDQVSTQLRHISHELHPPVLDELGLRPALKFLAEGVEKRSNLRVEVGYEGDREPRLPKPVQNALYRAVQEALNNTVRHARASRSRVCVQRDDHGVACTISDDGAGFEPSSTRDASGSNGLGLLGIRERAYSLHGSFRVDSAPGNGTTLSITIPLEGAQ